MEDLQCCGQRNDSDETRKVRTNNSPPLFAPYFARLYILTAHESILLLSHSSFLYRRLFPSVMVSVRGLNPRADYTISLRMRSADKYRYKFLNLEWVRVGESELMQNEDRQIFKHPSSPNSGQFWMKKPISFKTVKISHNSTNKHVSTKSDDASVVAAG